METLEFRQQGYFGVITYSRHFGPQKELVAKFTSQQAYDTLKACMKATQVRAEYIEKRMFGTVTKAVVIRSAAMVQWDLSTEIVVPPSQP
jgi:hypothetical protein